jgi:High potential iron-sulfur protein
MTSRRGFIRIFPAAGAALLGTRAMAQAPMLDEKDPLAVSLGYVADAARVDKAKFPKFAAGQTCANCALFQAPAGAAAGNCPLFAGKQVAAKGWCSAWAKKG